MAKWNAGTARAMLAADGIGTRGRAGGEESGEEELEEENLEEENWRRRNKGASFGSPWNTSSKALERLPTVVVFDRLFDTVRKVGEKVQAGPAFNLVHAYRVIPI